MHGGNARDRRRRRRYVDRLHHETYGAAPFDRYHPQNWGELNRVGRGWFGTYFTAPVAISGPMPRAGKTAFLDAMRFELKLYGTSFVKVGWDVGLVADPSVPPGTVYLIHDSIIVAHPGDGQLLAAVAAGGSPSATHAPVPGVRP